jgi:hypothetical protein
MIDVALQFLRDEVSAFFLSSIGASAAEVNLSSVLDTQGKYAIKNDSIGVSIINIEEERTVKTHLPQHVYLNGQHVISEPELKLNLYILFSANFGLYDQALKYLSFILRYFQTHPSFTQDEFPALDPRIEKLVLELQSPSFEQWNQIWSYHGGKQLPSVLYKARLVVIEPAAPSAVRPPVTKISATLQNA